MRNPRVTALLAGLAVAATLGLGACKDSPRNLDQHEDRKPVHTTQPAKPPVRKAETRTFIDCGDLTNDVDPCVTVEEDGKWYLYTTEGATQFRLCKTEDSDNCIWKSRKKSKDGKVRYLITKVW